jgi:hypothetical protein
MELHEWSETCLFSLLTALVGKPFLGEQSNGDRELVPAMN